MSDGAAGEGAISIGEGVSEAAGLLGSVFQTGLPLGARSPGV